MGESALEFPPRILEFGPFRIDTGKRLLLRGTTPIPLTPKAFDTLQILVENSGYLVDKDEIMKRLWPDTFVEEGSLTRNISVLRKALGESPKEHRYIVTVPGQGYRFVAEVREVEAHFDDDPEITFTERTRTSIVLTREDGEIEEGLVDREVMRHVGDLANMASGRQPAEVPLERRLPESAAISRRRRLLVAAGVLVVIMSLAGGYYLFMNPVGGGPGIEMTGLTATGNVVRAALSGDARYVVFAVSDTPTSSSLWVRQLVTFHSVQIVPPAEVEYLGITVSPDNSYVYYLTRVTQDSAPTLHRVSLLGGPHTRILEDVHSPVSLSPDANQFVFVRTRPAIRESVLMIANVDGTGEREIAKLESPEFFGDPAWSPDGALIAAGAGRSDGARNRYIAVIRVGEWELRELTRERFRWVGGVAWLPGSRNLVMIGTENSAEPYQVWQVSYPGGRARKLTKSTVSFSRLSLAPEAETLLVTQVRRVANVWLLSADEPTSPRQITFGSGGYRGDLAWTIDGKLVYESVTEGTADLSVMEADGSGQRTLLGERGRGAIGESPIVTPDGRYVVFAFDITGTRQIWRVDINGMNPVQLTHGPGEDRPHCSPDGRWVLYTETGSRIPTIWRVPIAGGQAEQLTQMNTATPAVSPDGRYFACFYLPENDSRRRLAVFPFAGGEPIRVFDQSVDAAVPVRWTRDGRALTYVDADGSGVSNIWLQPLEGGEPRRLTSFLNERVFGLDWSPDGKQLACVRGFWESNLVLIRNFN